MSYYFSAAELLDQKLNHGIRKYLKDDTKGMSASEINGLVETLKEEALDEILHHVAMKSPRLKEILSL